MQKSGTKLIITPDDPAKIHQSRADMNAARVAMGKEEIRDAPAVVIPSA